MTQLVPPNLAVVGYPDYCLAYVGSVFGLSSENTADAWQGWQATQFKHTDSIPTDVAVPVWFSWTGTIDGVTQNWGHVAVSTPNGVYTNPLSGTGHKVFASVPALEAAYGVKYVGWSEDISNLKVVEETMITNPDGSPATQAQYNDLLKWKPIGQQLSYSRIYPAMGGSSGNPDADPAQVQPIINDLESYGDFVKGSPAWQSNGGDLTKLQVVAIGSTGTVLVPGTYIVQ